MDTITVTCSREELLHTIARANGQLQKEDQFVCVMSVPYRFARSRHSFRFRGTIRGSAPEFQIDYRVYPTFKTLFLLAILIVLCISALFAFIRGALDFAFPTFLAVSALLTLDFAWQYRECRERFRDAFLRNQSA